MIIGLIAFVALALLAAGAAEAATLLTMRFPSRRLFEAIGCAKFVCVGGLVVIAYVLGGSDAIIGALLGAAAGLIIVPYFCSFHHF